jgi:hypothetical protein
LPEVASGFLSMLLDHPRFYSVVAAFNGEIISSNFMDERSPTMGSGPISACAGAHQVKHKRSIDQVAVSSPDGERRSEPSRRRMRSKVHED